jgi:glycosyltransferase involved in cell wall biosynthesis
MNPLSVFILTYNEENNIRACLESVTWADEVIVVDSFSSDRTVEICLEYTDKIFQHEFKGFGKQRKIALDHTTYDWVLSVDADERVTEELRNELLEILKNIPEADGFFIPRISHFLGKEIKHCGLYPDYRQLQFFNKNKMKYSDHLVHEGFVFSGQTSYLKEHILHYSFQTVEEYLRKMDMYSSLAAEDMIRAGKRGKFHQLFTHPASTFFSFYLIKRGFLDGKMGFILSSLYSYYTFIKYLKFWKTSGLKAK